MWSSQQGQKLADWSLWLLGGKKKKKWRKSWKVYRRPRKSSVSNKIIGKCMCVCVCHLYSVHAKHQKSFWPKWKVTEAQGETGWYRVDHYCASTRWGHTDPINRTLSLHFRRFQFTKSSRQTINVCNANVKTSLTHIKSSQGHCKCALMLTWDQTGPIKYDLKQAGWGGDHLA